MNILKKISKDLFQELQEMNLIDTTKNNSNCTTTSIQKPSRRKNKYVCEFTLKQRLLIKLKKKNKDAEMKDVDRMLQRKEISLTD